MEHLLGFIAFFFVALVTIFLGSMQPRVGFVLAVAFACRAAAALFHFYVAPLPGGTADAVSFERAAWYMASGGLSDTLGEFRGPDSYFISFVIALLYAATDRSLLMAQFLSVLAGVVSVFVSWLLACDLWGERIARKAAWGVAMFPMLIQYSALTLREAFFVLFMLLGLLGVVRWVRCNSLGWAISALLAFAVAIFFHGGGVIAALSFGLLVIYRAGRRLVASLMRTKIRVVSLGLVIMFLAGLLWFAVAGIALPKIGDFDSAVDTERWVEHTTRSARETGAAAYPAWLTPRTSLDLIWNIPVRTVYLLFSPFPWDVRGLHHLIGVVDGMLYMGLAFLIWHNRHSLRRNPEVRAIFWILLPVLVTFAIGTGNFGTGLRHRQKLVAVLIVLAAPLIPRLVWKRNRDRFTVADRVVV